jgi:hypothetical protein
VVGIRHGLIAIGERLHVLGRDALLLSFDRPVRNGTIA